MSSINIKIRNKPNRNGECPVILRITKDRKSKIITLGMHCKMAEWDHRNNNFKRSHVLSFFGRMTREIINHRLRKKPKIRRMPGANEVFIHNEWRIDPNNARIFKVVLNTIAAGCTAAVQNLRRYRDPSTMADKCNQAVIV